MNAKDLRLFIQSKLSSDPKTLGRLYEELSRRPLGDRKAQAEGAVVA